MRTIHLYTLHQDIKVFSALSAEEFAYGPYTLTVTDQSTDASFETAFDLGDWTSASRPRPSAIPSGQYIAYYKFDIGPEDKVYASITRDLNSGPTIALYDANRGILRAGDSELGGVITSAGGRKRLITPIDRSKCYLTVEELTGYDIRTLERHGGTFWTPDGKDLRTVLCGADTTGKYDLREAHRPSAVPDRFGTDAEGRQKASVKAASCPPIRRRQAQEKRSGLLDMLQRAPAHSKELGQAAIKAANQAESKRRQAPGPVPGDLRSGQAKRPRLWSGRKIFPGAGQ